jgi:hypothetical protein
MATNIPTTNLDEAAQLHQVAKGVTTYMAKGGPTVLLGTSYTPTALAALFNGFGDTVTAYEAARASLAQQRKELEQQQALIRKTLRAMHCIVLAAYWNNPAAIQAFGFTPPRTPTPRTGEEMVSAAAKAAQTRKALGTLGSTQKKEAIAAAHAAQETETGGGSSAASTTPVPPLTGPSATASTPVTASSAAPKPVEPSTSAK